MSIKKCKRQCGHVCVLCIERQVVLEIESLLKAGDISYSTYPSDARIAEIVSLRVAMAIDEQ